MFSRKTTCSLIHFSRIGSVHWSIVSDSEPSKGFKCEKPLNYAEFTQKVFQLPRVNQLPYRIVR